MNSLELHWEPTFSFLLPSGVRSFWRQKYIERKDDIDLCLTNTAISLSSFGSLSISLSFLDTKVFTMEERFRSASFFCLGSLNNLL